MQYDDQLAYYEYDALGRRSRKVTEAGVTEFLWQESQLIGEYHQGRYRWYFYQPESHVPTMLVQDGQCYFYQCDHLGTPLRLVTYQGEIVWQAHYETWGTAHIEIEQVTNPLRFQGQMMLKRDCTTTSRDTTIRAQAVLSNQTRLVYWAG
ncbi:RHS domain-containing protein [Vibrio navarrensis]